MLIKGISLPIEETGTGATAAFHQIAFYSVDPRSRQTNVHVSGYVSESTQADGRSPLMTRAILINGAPERGGDVMDWIYSELIKPAVGQAPVEIAPGIPDVSNMYAGGKLVQDAA